jgi:hypothetical protein
MECAFSDIVDKHPESIPGYGEPGKVSLGRLSNKYALVHILETFDLVELGEPECSLKNGERKVIVRAKDGGQRVLEQRGYPYLCIKLGELIDTGGLDIFMRVMNFQIWHTVFIEHMNDLNLLDEIGEFFNDCILFLMSLTIIVKHR